MGMRLEGGSWRCLTRVVGTRSTSRKGNCLVKAVAENFFGHFKEEFIRRRRFASVAQFRGELDAYIHWFNNERIREKLHGLSPVGYREALLVA